MASIYATFVILAPLPFMALASHLTKSANPSRVLAGLGLLGLCTLAAAGIAVHSATAGRWGDLALTALLFLAVALQWDLALARLTGRLPRFTLWVTGYKWAPSTNDRRPRS